MIKFLPFIFLIAIFSLFGISWIAFSVDPDSAPWYIFALFVLLVFVCVYGLLGLAAYFVRTRLYRRYSAKWYFYTSFKMAFFVSLFVSLVTALAILQLVSKVNIFLTICAVVLFALWSYLGKVKSD